MLNKNFNCNNCTKENVCKYKEVETPEIILKVETKINNTPMVATAFRGSNLTEEEESAVDHLFDMMTAIKQQVLLRRALYNKK